MISEEQRRKMNLIADEKAFYVGDEKKTLEPLTPFEFSTVDGIEVFDREYNAYKLDKVKSAFDYHCDVLEGSAGV